MRKSSRGREIQGTAIHTILISQAAAAADGTKVPALALHLTAAVWHEKLHSPGAGVFLSAATNWHPNLGGDEARFNRVFCKLCRTAALVLVSSLRIILQVDSCLVELRMPRSW